MRKLLKSVFGAVALGSVFIASAAWVSCAHSRSPASVDAGAKETGIQFADWISRDHVSPTRPIAVIGDTQRTLAAERLLGREQNDPERPILIHGLVADAPGLIVHLGDMTNHGASESAWKQFDELTEPIRTAGIPLLPCMGNHDYWGDDGEVFDEIRPRFPMLESGTWYSRIYGSLGLIWLDSNPADLDDEDWKAEQRWFHDQLNELEHTASIRGIFVFLHHPPFTNSAVTGDEVSVQKAFLPDFLASKKTLAMITGHAHTYEHFLIQGKNFIVSGGGGGPRVKLKNGKSARHPDLFQGPAPRPFNYLLLTPGSSGVHVTVRGLDKGATQIRDIDGFELAFP